MTATIDLNPSRYSAVLLAVAVLLVVIHVGLNAWHYQVEEITWLIRQLFELDEENNLPTWFSSYLLLNCAIALWLVAAADADGQRTYWRLLGLGFLVLAIDEVAGLHESFHTAIDFNWTLAAAPLVLIVGVMFIPFIRALDRRRAGWFITAGVVYVSGALGVEFLARDMDEDSLAYSFAVALEEGMEMAGALIFFRVNAAWLASEQPSFTLNLGGRR